MHRQAGQEGGLSSWDKENKAGCSEALSERMEGQGRTCNSALNPGKDHLQDPILPVDPHLGQTQVLHPERESELTQPVLLDMKPLSPMLQIKAQGSHPTQWDRGNPHTTPLKSQARVVAQLTPWPWHGQ